MDPRPNSAPTGSAQGERTLGTLFRDLSSETTRLFRQEVTLARLELAEAGKRVARDAVAIGLGGAVAAVGSLVLVACLVLALGALLENYWLAALIVGLVLVAAGGVAAMRALSSLREAHLAPQETMESLQTTQRWAGAKAAEVKAVLTGAGGDGRPYGESAAPGLPANRIGQRQIAAAAPVAERTDATERQRARENEPQEGLWKRTWNEIQEDDVFGQAAKVAYFAFMSFPPALLVIFGLTGFFGGEETGERIQAELEAVLPAATHDLIEGLVAQVTQSAPGPFSIGLLLALWAASTVFVGLGDSLNKAYDVEEERSWIKRRLVAIGVMVAFVVLLLGGTVLLLAGPSIARGIGLGETGVLIWNIAQWPLVFALVVLAFWVAYYALPNRDQSACKGELFKAAAGAAVLWLVATAAFRLYIANFGSYTETYGIIGAVLVLLLWMYLTGIVILAGGELASEMEEGA